MSSIALDHGNARLKRHAAELLRLAIPVMVARAGIIVMAVVDTLFVGHYGAVELAYLGLGGTPVGVFFATIVGLMMGTIVMASQALGAGNPAECGAVWRRSLPWAALVGFAFLAVCLVAEPLFLLAGQEPDLARGGAGVILVLGYGMPAGAIYITTAFYLEGLKRPMPGMVAMLLANVANVGLNWVFVFGKLGFPEMGAEGAAWATTSLRWATAIGLVVYVLTMADHERFASRGTLRGWWRDGAEQRRLGYAAGLSQGLESSAFGALGLFAGMLGALALAAYTVALNLLALPFMAALGLASATAVRVGAAHGAGDRRELVTAGWMGLAVTSVILAVAGAFYGLLPETIAGAFAKEPELIAAILPLIGFSAWILVVDGGQVVMASALRGRGDAWIPTALHFVSYYAVMIPAGAALAFWAGRGVLGLYEGIFIASVVSVAILSARFWWLSRR
ncbi:MAG TPA: MATE family efflux transporter [Azospirillaceae bacterium]|nr:MATE family efflux transporter [Azospirillaceae bacterium]